MAKNSAPPAQPHSVDQHVRIRFVPFSKDKSSPGSFSGPMTSSAAKYLASDPKQALAALKGALRLGLSATKTSLNAIDATIPIAWLRERGVEMRESAAW